MSVSKAILTRKESGNSGTFGTLSLDNFNCLTVELPDRNNEPNTSCIPKGQYTCKWTHSPRLDKYTYEVLNVPNRDGIRIHSANYPDQLLGCIALGSYTANVNGKEGVFNSRDTTQKFETLLNQQDFILEIV